MNIDDLQINFPDLCAKYGVKKLEIFGSFARGDAGDSSDLDLIVQFDGLIGLVDRFFGLKNDLEHLTHRSVDILPNKSFKNPIFARNVNRERRVVYG